MSRQSARSHWSAALSGLTWPLLIGAAASSIFYVLVHEGPLKNPFMYRYFASHPVLYVETTMFFIGLAALLLKLQDLLKQSVTMGRVELPPAEESAPETAESGLRYLAELPKSLRSSYLIQRLVHIFEFVEWKQGPDGLDDEMKFLADQDAMRQQESYSLVRIVAWATPMLGFLGTVIGITKALGDLDPKLFAIDMTKAMQGLLSGLYVAFDTTALALVLSMVLMFLLFFADRIESQLLAAVDVFVNEQVAARFRAEPGTENPYLRSVVHMSQAVIRTTETLIRQQTDQWKAAMSESMQQLGQVAEATGQQVRLAIGESLNESLKNHAERLAEFESHADQQMRARWEQWQSALAENVRVVREQQAEVVKQSELLTKISGATHDVARLEQTLNQNLAALAGARHFEETVLSLSAAIQLLSAKLSHVPERSGAIDLKSSAQGKAA